MMTSQKTIILIRHPACSATFSKHKGLEWQEAFIECFVVEVTAKAGTLVCKPTRATAIPKESNYDESVSVSPTSTKGVVSDDSLSHYECSFYCAFKSILFASFIWSTKSAKNSFYSVCYPGCQRSRNLSRRGIRITCKFHPQMNIVEVWRQT